jgi:hypothetical protein
MSLYLLLGAIAAALAAAGVLHRRRTLPPIEANSSRTCSPMRRGRTRSWRASHWKRSLAAASDFVSAITVPGP